MKDLMHLVWYYQYLWLPLLVGMAVGVVAITTTDVMLRRRRKAAAKAESREQLPASPGYDPFIQGSPGDQRKCFRRNGNPVEVQYRLVDSKIVGHGLVLDRSVGGLRLGLDQEITVGTHLLLLPGGASDMTPWTEVEVRTCRTIGDSWELGCQFVKVPPWSILLMFG